MTALALLSKAHDVELRGTGKDWSNLGVSAPRDRLRHVDHVGQARAGLSGWA